MQGTSIYGSERERCFDEKEQQIGIVSEVKLGRRHVRANTDARGVYRSQTTVENCIGGHVNVLSDYKKMLKPKILKIFTATAIISLTC